MRILFVILFLIASSVAAAQDSPDPDPTPFRRALSFIPDISADHDSVPLFSYADYDAALQARGIERPARLEDYLKNKDAYGPLTLALPSGGPMDLLTNLFAAGEDYPATIGIDFFEIGQGIQFGTPPTLGQILLGDFSKDAVAAAYTARDYAVEREIDDGILLCPADGCDSGTRMALKKRLLSNPFGGSLGRSEPLFAADDVLLNSAGYEVLKAMIDTYEGRRSMANLREFQAIADVLDGYPFVMSVSAFSPFSLRVSDLRLVDSANRDEVMERLKAHTELAPLPLYSAFALASVADSENEYGLAMLVYSDEGTAQAAAAAIDERLTSIESIGVPGRTYADLLSEFGTLEPSAVIADASNRMFVVVVRVGQPIPANTPNDQGTILPSYLLYNRLVQMIFTRDSYWLLWGGVR